MLKRGVTPIEDLIDLDNEERNETIGKVRNRAIRNLGMNGGMSEYEKVYSQPPPPQQRQIEPEHSYLPPPPQAYHHQHVNMPSYENISCLVISDHAHNCPVCSRLYNTDKSIYIVIISILVIICIIMLKKVLEK
jgi:hypothetical protein